MSTDDAHEMLEGEEPPPRGVRAMGIVRWIFLAGSILLAALAWWSVARADLRGAPSAAQHVRYRCPMHPQIVRDEPGECPICHMRLEPFTPPKGPGAPPPPSGSTSAATMPPKLVAVELELDRVQAIGVRTTLVEQRDTRRTIRVTAVVAPPEQGASEVHVRTAGFVEQIAVEETGRAVSEGQLLFALYSPELLQAQAELLASRKWASPAGDDPTLEAGKRKLALLGMHARDVDRVLASGEPLRAVPVYAPRGGVVTKKAVVLGSRVTPDMALYELVDLSRVYVTASLFPRDAPLVEVGAEGRFTPASRPDAPITAKIDLVYPSLEAESRTTRVRMIVPNEKRTLLPGAYGTVEIATAPRKVIVVPRDAVVDTGEGAHVFVVMGPGRFSPRTVVVGDADGDSLTIESGLVAGDRVVSGATFLIDAESRLQASLAVSRSGP